MDEHAEVMHEKKSMSRNEGYVNIRVPKDVKMEAQQILQQLGLDTSTAIHMFLRKVISYGGIPFDLRLTNQEREHMIVDTDIIEKKG